MSDNGKELLNTLKRIAAALEEIAAWLREQHMKASEGMPEELNRCINRYKNYEPVKDRSLPTENGQGDSIMDILHATINLDRVSNDTGNKTDSETDNEDQNTVAREKYIIDYLSSRHIKVKNILEEDTGTTFLDNIANFMGSRYGYIRDFYLNFKQCLNTGNSFRMDLRNKEPLEISYTCQLAQMLYQVAFLTEYRYQKSPLCLLKATPCRVPSVINFMSGKWLEKYTKNEVIKAIKAVNNNLNYLFLHGIQIILPDGTESELDLLFEVEQQIFWFEAKTGDYQNYIHRYARISDILGLDYDHCYLILTDITTAGAEALCSIFKMTVLPIEKIGEKLKAVFSQHFTL